MDFKTDIFELDSKNNYSVKLVGLKLPSPKDVIFKSKKDELFQQYESARLFIRETETDDWKHWFQTEDIKYQKLFELLFRERFYESALIFYNIIVDLSWTLCYLSAEYALYTKDKTINLNNMMTIEESYDALRKAENLVTNPDGINNPFNYLKHNCPEFTDSINLVIDFWKKFKNSEIRASYNFIKHKGKPLYEEIESYNNSRVMKLSINNEFYPTDIKDVKKVVNLCDSINKLREFDDEILFPYIKKLFQLLEIAVDPSPIVY